MKLNRLHSSFSNTKGLILLKKRYVLITILIIFVFMVVCGYISHKNKKEHYIQTQEKRIDLYFKYNLKDYHSMHVTSFKKNPMGGYFIKGYINNDKNYDFDATIFSSHSTQFKGDIGYDDKTLGKLFISDDPKNDLSPNEIIKKEHLDKDKYEAEPPAFFLF